MSYMDERQRVWHPSVNGELPPNARPLNKIKTSPPNVASTLPSSSKTNPKANPQNNNVVDVIVLSDSDEDERAAAPPKIDNGSTQVAPKSVDKGMPSIRTDVSGGRSQTGSRKPQKIATSERKNSDRSSVPSTSGRVAVVLNEQNVRVKEVTLSKGGQGRILHVRNGSFNHTVRMSPFAKGSRMLSLQEEGRKKIKRVLLGPPESPAKKRLLHPPQLNAEGANSLVPLANNNHPPSSNARKEITDTINPILDSTPIIPMNKSQASVIGSNHVPNVLREHGSALSVVVASGNRRSEGISYCELKDITANISRALVSRRYRGNIKYTPRLFPKWSPFGSEREVYRMTEIQDPKPLVMKAAIVRPDPAIFSALGLVKTHGGATEHPRALKKDICATLKTSQNIKKYIMNPLIPILHATCIYKYATLKSLVNFGPRPIRNSRKPKRRSQKRQQPDEDPESPELPAEVEKTVDVGNENPSNTHQTVLIKNLSVFEGMGIWTSYSSPSMKAKLPAPFIFFDSTDGTQLNYQPTERRCLYCTFSSLNVLTLRRHLDVEHNFSFLGDEE